MGLTKTPVARRIVDAWAERFPDYELIELRRTNLPEGIWEVIGSDGYGIHRRQRWSERIGDFL